MFFQVGLVVGLRGTIFFVRFSGVMGCLDRVLFKVEGISLLRREDFVLALGKD